MSTPSAIKQTLADLTKKSMKEGDKDTLSVARMLHAAIRKKEIDDRVDLDDGAVMKVVSTLIKQRQDAIEQFKAGGREDLVAKETKEVAFLSQFLPQQMSEGELAALVDGVIAEVKPTSAKDMGAVMKAVLAKVAGRADGKMVNQIVKQKLTF